MAEKRRPAFCDPELARKAGLKGNKSGRRPAIAIRDAIVAAMDELGDPRTGKEQRVGYLKWLAVESPAAFAGLIRQVMPTLIHAEVEHRHDLGRLSTEQLEELERLLALADAGTGDAGAPKPAAVHGVH